MRLVPDQAVPRDDLFLGHVLMQWTVVAIAIGGGADGEGETPSPVSREELHTSSTPPPPAPRRRPPPRAGGGRAVHGGKAGCG
jgi:hypothetical protein